MQSINSHTFVNGFTPTQLALGRESHLPGLLSDERTGPLQLQMTEQERLCQKKKLKIEAQQACARAEVDVKLRRAPLRKFNGRDEDLHQGEAAVTGMTCARSLSHDSLEGACSGMPIKEL